MKPKSRASDKEIRDKVLHELQRSPCIQDTPLEVNADDGVVTLGGTVWSYDARVAAAAAAHQVDEIRDVANDIVVEITPGMGRTDTEIAQAVRRMLEWGPSVPCQQIRTTTAEGCVTLTGWVACPKEREETARIAARVPGVQRVINDIRVVHAESCADHIHRVLATALERRAQRQARRLEIEVTDGVVKLEGPVDSLAEHRVLIDAAREIPGVKAVDDQLRIEPGV
jgi:osmotically-inducible protein OsmY